MNVDHSDCWEFRCGAIKVVYRSFKTLACITGTELEMLYVEVNTELNSRDGLAICLRHTTQADKQSPRPLTGPTSQPHCVRVYQQAPGGETGHTSLLLAPSVTAGSNGWMPSGGTTHKHMQLHSQIVLQLFFFQLVFQNFNSPHVCI